METTDEDPFHQLRAALRGPDADDGTGTRRRGLIAAGAATALLGMAIVVGSWLRPAAPATRPDAEPLSAQPTAASTSSTTTTTATERLWPSEPVEIDGTELRAAGRRWSVGAEGDLVAVGDWWCDGRRTVAVLRPSASRL